MFLFRIIRVMNLTNYGVQELNAQELKDIDGGWDLFDIGYEIGYFFGALLANTVEGMLPF